MGSHSATSPLVVKMDGLQDCVKARHSTRYFLPDPVPREVLMECLSLAQLAASNSNTQPWRLFLATGAARDRVRDALMAEARQHGPNVPPLPEGFKHFRSEFGRLLYGPDGYDIKREDTAGRTAAVMRNYEFFGAPVAGVVCMPKTMGIIDALGVGMWAQTLLLAFTERGLGACLQVSVAGYPEVLRREFGIGEDLDVICGFSIGYPDREKKVNNVVTARQEVEECVVFAEE